MGLSYFPTAIMEMVFIIETLEVGVEFVTNQMEILRESRAMALDNTNSSAFPEGFYLDFRDL